MRVCLEATGLYGLDLALTLHRAAVPVMVAIPRALRHFATELMQRSKNDRLDAQVLREAPKRHELYSKRDLKEAQRKICCRGRKTGSAPMSICNLPASPVPVTSSVIWLV